MNPIHIALVTHLFSLASSASSYSLIVYVNRHVSIGSENLKVYANIVVTAVVRSGCVPHCKMRAKTGNSEASKRKYITTRLFVMKNASLINVSAFSLGPMNMFNVLGSLWQIITEAVNQPSLCMLMFIMLIHLPLHSLNIRHCHSAINVRRIA